MIIGVHGVGEEASRLEVRLVLGMLWNQVINVNNNNHPDGQM